MRAADARAGRDERLAAFGELVERFSGMACGYAYAALGDFHLAEDAAQEAFVSAFQRIDTLQDPAAFAGWLRRLVTTACSRATRRRQVPRTPLATVGEIASSGPEPPKAVEAAEMREQVLRAIGQLPPHEREATTLFYINGYSQQEVAAFLEVPVSTVKNRLHAARGRLKERMLPMVKDTLHDNAPDERFNARVIEALLDRPRPLQMPDHPVRKVWDAIRTALPDYEVIEGEEVITREQQLRVSGGVGYGYPEPAGQVLRTSTTGVTLAALAGRTPPIRLLTAGRVFRGKASPSEAGLGTGEDAWHARVFHNADALCVEPAADIDAMKRTIERVLAAVFAGQVPEVRWEAESFPSFEQGLDLGAQLGGQWRSIAGCGMVPAALLTEAGIDTAQHRAFAFGLGLERLAMLRYGIEDIRALWQPPYVVG